MELVSPNGLSCGKPHGLVQPPTLSFRIGVVLYSLLASMGTMPILLGGRTYSFEYFFSIALALLFVIEIIAGTLQIPKPCPIYLIGVAVWLFASATSAALNGGDGAAAAVIRLGTKVAFSFLTFVVLANNRRVETVLWAYLTGCAVAGVFTCLFFVRGGDFESLRQTTFAGHDSTTFAFDFFGGLAAMGASNLAPLWVSLALVGNQRSPSNRRLLLFLIPYFALLSVTSLRREVLAEGFVGLLVLLVVSPPRHRYKLMLGGFVLICALGVVLCNSERWQQRLFVESREQFETLTDPRLLLLLNTPAELAEAPLFGHGPESYRFLMLKHMPFIHPLIEERGIAAHNTFSKAAVETGGVGLLGLLLMLSGLGWKTVLSCRSSKSFTSLLRVTALLMLLRIGTAMTFQDGSVSNTMWYFIGILLYLNWELSNVEPQTSAGGVTSRSACVPFRKGSS